MAKKKKKKKKATRCTRKTKAGKRCKSKAPAGRKTCVSHGGPTKKKAKRKAKKKVAKKATKKKATRKKRKKVRRRALSHATKAKCAKILVSGKKCKCYCEPGGVYCATHTKKTPGARARIRKNPNRASINCPWKR
jgi:hypothetical protein